MSPKRCVSRTCTRHPMLLPLFALLYFSGTDCGFPQASQEGTLHSFKSYTDVATFHYTVPAGLLRATWQFAAFMDDRSCPPRTVHIYLQWGSYPVIAADNSSFPPNVSLQGKRPITLSTITSLEPRTGAVVPVHSPQPGDWFVGAYLSHWDERVLQQGLGHKCHYSVGSIAVWKRANDIREVPVGCQRRLRTAETTTYYRMFVPAETWTLKVKLWGCTFTVHSSRGGNPYCIKGIVLQGRVLPNFDHTRPLAVGNLTTTDSYTFTVSAPYENSYYYLLVVSDSIIEFNIEVNTSRCPIMVTESSSPREYFNRSTTWEASRRVGVGDVPYHSAHRLDSNFTLRPDGLSRDNNEYRSVDGDVRYDSCVPRFQLTRIKHPQPFSAVYLLQGREWLTSWLPVTDLCPVVTQFVIHPFVDIGGTLDISVHLELYKSQTRQLVTVHACVRRGRVPDYAGGQLVCDGNDMSMNLSSYDEHDARVLIPYPEPDTWHVGLEAKCFSRGQPVKCEMEEILVSLNVETRQCVFPGNWPCGQHGTCDEIHRGLLYYTTCNCIEGYAGWGCTDATTSNPESFRVLTALILVLSNGFFVPAICLAVGRKLYTEALVYTATMLFSSLYHACDQRIVAYCTARYEVLQWCDFFASILAFWVTLIAIARLPARVESLCHMLGVFVISYGVELDRTSLNSILVPLAVGVTIPVASYVHGCFRSKRLTKPAGAWKLLVGLLLAASGLLLFSLVETEANYKYVHSAWHTIIAGSLIFLLPAARKEAVCCTEGSSTTADDSHASGNTSGSPIFAVASGQERLFSDD